MYWSKLGTTHYHGEWLNLGWFGACFFTVSEGNAIPPLPAGHNYLEVRTATRIYDNISGPAWSRRVAGGVRHGNSC